MDERSRGRLRAPRQSAKRGLVKRGQGRGATMRWTRGFSIALLGTLAVAGCGGQQKLAASLINCNAADVVITDDHFVGLSGRAYTATCGDRVYACKGEQTTMNTMLWRCTPMPRPPKVVVVQPAAAVVPATVNVQVTAP